MMSPILREMLARWPFVATSVPPSSPGRVTRIGFVCSARSVSPPSRRVSSHCCREMKVLRFAACETELSSTRPIVWAP